MIPQQIIDSIISSADIVKVISRYQQLTKAGVNYKGLCPFHADRDPSLIVSPVKGIWKCFSCGKGGNVIGYVQMKEGVSFVEAVKIVAQEVGIVVPEKELTPEEREKAKRRESLDIVMRYTQKYFEDQAVSPDPFAYLSTRDVSNEVLKEYGVGYCPGSFNSFSEKAIADGYNRQYLIDCGLVSEHEGRLYDRFRGRITFPFYDVRGKIIGFTGRIIEKKDTAKYLNSPETELFHKGSALFGIYQARQHIANLDKCYLVEGQFDVLSMVGSGVRNVVCGSGTALTSEQIKLIRRYTRNVTVIYDGDDAGKNASEKNIRLLLQQGMNTRAVRLPDGEDPDSFCHRNKKVQQYLDKQEMDFVSYLIGLNRSSMDDPVKKGEVIHLIAELISYIDDASTWKSYVTLAIDKFKIDGETIRDLVLEKKNLRKKEAPEIAEEVGMTGIEEAEELMKVPNAVLEITWDRTILAEKWGQKPVIFISGKPGIESIQDLRRISPAIQCADRFVIKEDLKEHDGIRFIKELVKQGCSVIMSRFSRKREKFVDDDGEESSKFVTIENKVSFTEWYLIAYSEFAEAEESVKKVAIERCAEVISYTDPTTRTFQMATYASYLGITKSSLESILKPFVAARKSESRFSSDSLQLDGEAFYFDASNIPGYVEEDPEINRIWKSFNFFPLINKQGKKIAYMFNTGKRSFVRVGNFYIDPLLHVYDKDTASNKRIVMLTQAGHQHPVYMEWISAEMITLQTFRKRLWEEGDINFSNGDQRCLDLIIDSWTGKFKKCTELHMFGYHDEGFYAFSNAIVHEVDGKQTVDQVDDLGLIEHNKQYYYIPAFSKIYASARKDNDRYYLDRFIQYKENRADKIDWKRWAELMYEVYKENKNGMWAVIYAVMCAFRSDIYAHKHTFTALFFIGPTGSGKSQIGYSIRSLFMPPTAPIFNLNSGTPAALFTWMERYRNIPVMLDEYNDQQINPVIFQALKSAVYDGEGKQKRRDATSKELDSSQVNAALIIMGQESPQQDDNSLANRCIICEVPKKDDRTEREEEVFNRLKGYEDGGLHQVLLEILKQRGAFVKHYQEYYVTATKELKQAVRLTVRNTDGLTRIIETVSMFLAVCRVIEAHSDLKLPFSYQAFFDEAVAKVVKQVESISSSNKMYGFFNTIGYLINTGSVIQGRDYKIESPGKITIKRHGRETDTVVLSPSHTKVLYLNMTNIYPMYQREVQKEALSLQSLNVYFDSHEAFIGRVRSTRYKWSEVREVPKDVTESDNGSTVNDNTMKRVIKEISVNTSAVCFNYDRLKESIDVDFEQRDAEEVFKEEEERKQKEDRQKDDEQEQFMF